MEPGVERRMWDSSRMSLPFSRISLQTLGDGGRCFSAEVRADLSSSSGLLLKQPADGRKTRSRLFSSMPSVWAPVALASHSAAARCAAFIPPLCPRD